MKKVFALAAVIAALAVMSIVFVGCNKEVAPDATLAEKLMGRWIVSASFNALSVINI